MSTKELLVVPLDDSFKVFGVSVKKFSVVSSETSLEALPEKLVQSIAEQKIKPKENQKTLIEIDNVS